VLVAVLMQGRTLVFAPAGTLAIIAALCVGLVAVTYASHPLVANVARVIGALAAGPLLARFIERLSWMLAVCLGITFAGYLERVLEQWHDAQAGCV